MDFALSETHDITRKMVREFAEREIAPESRKYDESQEVPSHWATKMAGLGLLGVFVPEKLGGAGLDSIFSAILIEELRRVGASAGGIPAGEKRPLFGPVPEVWSGRLKKEDKMGIRASDTMTLGFDNCRIPKGNLLGTQGKGFNIALATLDGGRIGIAAQALGIAQRALEESLKYSQEREAFGSKIAEFQAIQWKLADMATEIDAARLLTYRAAWMRDQGMRHTYESSAAKLYASEASHRAVDAALQIHGGYGFIKDYVVEKLYRDQRITELYEGTSEVQRLVIARAVLGR